MTLAAPNGSSANGRVPRSPLQSSSFHHTIPSSSTQAQMDGLATSFVEQATDWRSLAAMMAGGLFYRLGRLGTMALPIQAFGQTPLRILSYGVGLASEVTAFQATQLGIDRLTDPARFTLHSSRFWENWRPSFVTLATLRGFGALGGHQNLFIQHFMQDTGMVAGYHLTARLGINPAPERTLTEQFLHAEATTLQWGAGMSLGHGMMPAWMRMERGFDLMIQGRDAHGAGLGTKPEDFLPIVEPNDPVLPESAALSLIPSNAHCMAGFGEGLSGLLSPETILGATVVAAMVFGPRSSSNVASHHEVLEVDNGPLGHFTRHTLNGVNIYRPIIPETIPTRSLIVLISGALGNHTSFGELPRQLAEAGFSVQILTIPGYDFDDPPSRLREVSAQATEAHWHHSLSRTVREIITNYGEGPVHMGGFSLGGAAAVRIFSELPIEQRHRIERMVLAAPALVFRQLNENSLAHNWFNRHLVLPILATLGISSRYLGPITGDATLDPHLHYYRHATRRCDYATVLYGEAARASLEHFAMLDHRPQTLFLYDPEDPRIDPISAELLQEAFRVEPHNLNPINFRNTDHLIFLFPQREQAFRAIREFLEIKD